MIEQGNRELKRIAGIGVLAAISAFGIAGCGGNTANLDSASGRKESSNSYDTNLRANTSLPNINSGVNGNNSVNSNTMAVADFWTQAAQSGLAEVAMGRLASTKAQNAEVKDFAQMMVAEHTKSNAELMALADKKGRKLPTEPNAMQNVETDKLNNLSGADFDREYMRNQVTAHETAVQLFEEQAESGTDAELKAFAAKSLPVLQKHLESARKIQQSVR